MIDPITVTAGKAVAEAGTEAATSFLRTLLGPAVAELGESFGDYVRVYRLRNQLKLEERVKKMLKDAGREPGTVPPRVLLPLLEHATLEDDDQLCDMWAALLANSSLGGAIKATIYVDVLRQVSPAEARLLKEIEFPSFHSHFHQMWLEGRFRSGSSSVEHPLSPNQKDFLARLLCVEPEDIVIALDHLESLGVVHRTVLESSLGSLAGTSFSLSLFGSRLLDACRAPRSSK